ncbi:hypothetical protein [Neolewinella litorea]|uniref:Uncharacterized protein n=1 Tax=Neolewinella litorea TaxID=2562452 RepID=A0A4S4NQ71_9BACT|nr:hypothetical protein [Neolewinella litorea]THH41265.1 hypothetical protein E4021_01310 [Neolewinella litorea]
MIRKPNYDPDNPPSSNIFGWRVSLIGLAVIVILSAVAAYRTYVLDVPIGFEDPLKQPESKNYYREKAEREAAELDSLRRQQRND